ncbi:MAG TPA: hypothetical protein VK540_15980 [Polyangiaceae bacterium]|nr:hypothetical protein [Polyangiaceae bacterium]
MKSKTSNTTSCVTSPFPGPPASAVTACVNTITNAYIVSSSKAENACVFSSRIRRMGGSVARPAGFANQEGGR